MADTMPDPTVTVRRRGANSLTLNLNLHSWNLTRDGYYLIVDALNAYGWELSDKAHEDAVWLQAIAAKIKERVEKADEANTNDIRNVFG